MTIEQKRQVFKVREHIKEIRDILDSVMYGDEGWCLSDSDFNRVRKCYDRICQANDEL